MPLAEASNRAINGLFPDRTGRRLHCIAGVSNFAQSW
jgi:hypothetical protein